MIINCKYNKKNKRFNVYENNTDFSNSVWAFIYDYTTVCDKKKIVLFGSDACNQYVLYTKNKLSYENDVDKESLMEFMSFKNKLSKLIYYICSQGYIVTNSEICDKYLAIINKCNELYNARKQNFELLFKELTELQKEESLLIVKLCGLRKINN